MNAQKTIRKLFLIIVLLACRFRILPSYIGHRRPFMNQNDQRKRLVRKVPLSLCSVANHIGPPNFFAFSKLSSIEIYGTTHRKRKKNLLKKQAFRQRIALDGSINNIHEVPAVPCSFFATTGIYT